MFSIHLVQEESLVVGKLSSGAMEKRWSRMPDAVASVSNQQPSVLWVRLANLTLGKAWKSIWEVRGMYTQVLYTEKVAVFQPFNESPDRDYK